MARMEMFPEQTWQQNLGIQKNYCNFSLGLCGGVFTAKVTLSPWTFKQMAFRTAMSIQQRKSPEVWPTFYKNIREIFKIKSTEKATIWTLFYGSVNYVIYHYIHFSIMFCFHSHVFCLLLLFSCPSSVPSYFPPLFLSSFFQERMLLG